MLRFMMVGAGALLSLYSAWGITFLPYSIGNYLSSVLGLTLLCAGLGLYILLEFTRSGWRRAARLVVSCAAAAALLAFCAMLAGVWLNARNVPASGHDAVLILGAALVGDVIPQGFRNRLDTAITYLEHNGNAVAVVSGGQGRRETVTAAYAMKAYLVDNGISPERIIKEDRAASTYENFIFAQELLDARFGGRPYTIVYVTNDFHLLRARLIAHRIGISGEGLAAPSQWFMLPGYYAREVPAMLRALATIRPRSDTDLQS